MPDFGNPTDIFEWPWFGLTEDVRPTARARLSAGRPIALATLVDMRGSSPRPVGSRMLIDANGVPEGYVSGGCVEASVASFALDVLKDGKPRLITLGAGSQYVDIRLPCGGSIDLYIERITPDDPDLKIPHMGWNALRLLRDHPLLAGIASGDHAYFVHSYHLLPEAEADLLAEVVHGGPVTAMVGRGNIAGTQFHPEKSQATGLKLIENFLDWRP